MPPNTGVIIEQRPTDWIAGVETGIAYIDRRIKWANFLPTNEKQYFTKFDSHACVSFAATNCIETQLNAFLAMGLLSAELCAPYLDANGKFNFSDRFLAKMSGTTINGNSLQAVIDCTRRCGLVAEVDWPTLPNMDFATYYGEIPQAVKDKALKFLEIFDIAYEWVIRGTPNLERMKIHIKQAPLQVATAICPGWNTDHPSTCNNMLSAHSYMIHTIDDYQRALDHYEPFLKKLGLDYPVVWAMKIVATSKRPVPPKLTLDHEFNVPIPYLSTSSEVKALQTALKIEGLFNANITGYFGPLTLEAVKAFQRKYAADILEPLGLKEATGRVALYTRAKLNELYNMSGTTEIVEGGFWRQFFANILSRF